MGCSHGHKWDRVSLEVLPRFVICFIFGIIAIALLVSVPAVEGELILDEVERVCEHNKSIIDEWLIASVNSTNHFLANEFNDSLFLVCAQLMTYFVGNTDEEELYAAEPPVFKTFTQAYHTLGIPAVDYWSETKDFFKTIRPALVNIREVQRDTLRHNETQVRCNASVIAALKNNGHLPEKKKCVQITKELQRCWDYYERVIIQDQFYYQIFHAGERDLSWYWRMCKACYQTVVITMEAFYRAVTPLYYNGRHPRWDYSPFGLMLRDAVEYTQGVSNYINKTFPDYIEKVKADGKVDLARILQERLDDIKNRLKDPTLDYPLIYFDGNWKQLFAIWKYHTQGLDKFTEEIRSIYFTIPAVPGAKYIFPEYVNRWRLNTDNFVVDSTVAQWYKDKVEDLWNSYVRVEPSSDPAYDSSRNNTLVRDGKWRWIARAPLHNMRLNWDLMGAVLEELKCYTKQEYFFDLRQKAIRDTQLDLTGDGALFSGISHSMLQPCRIDNNNEADLVTRYCTAENHEICAPMSPFHVLQRPESPYHGGLGLLKPRWIYKYDEKNVKCVGRRDYFTLMYVCRCGFRLDCGDDLGENITCQLVENDRLRGQCRGGVAYPCKTLPLAPGKHNETCASGYCHMRRNSCEDRPFIYQESSVAVSVLRVISSLDRCLIQFIGILVALQRGGILANL